MKLVALVLLVTLCPPASIIAFSQETRNGLTGPELAQLAKKAARGLRKCKQLQGHPEISILIENKTAEKISKDRLSELIHSEIERKTHAGTPANPAEFEILASLESQNRTVPRAYHSATILTYTLRTQVFQGKEKLCENRAELRKPPSGN